MRRIRKRAQIKPQLFFRQNEAIRVPEVRLLDENDVHIGIMPTTEALAMARERGFDLVEINPKGLPPIAKIIEYGQFKYQKEKELKKQKVAQKKTDIKGVRLSARIGKHDMDVRLRSAKAFLEEGNKIKIEILLRGRERQHADIGEEQIRAFIKLLSEEVDVKIEQPVKRMGGQLTAIVASAK